MANSSLVYSVKINGLDVATEGVENLTESVENLGDAFVQVSNEVDLKPVNTEVESLNENLDNLDNNLDDLSGKNIKLPTKPIEDLGKQSTLTAEKVDKLSAAGEKGFKGLSDALKLFGIDTSILDNVKDSLGALGDLLDSQSKIKDVAFDSAPIKEQAESIVDLTQVQKTSTVATEAGAAAQTAAGTATKGATIATQALNAALKALPWIAIGAAVVFVVSKLIDWSNESKKATENVKKGFDDAEKSIKKLGVETKNRIDSITNEGQRAKIINADLVESLNSQISVLEAQGAPLEQIVAKRKEILRLQIEGLNIELASLEKLKIERFNEFQANVNQVNKLRDELQKIPKQVFTQLKGFEPNPEYEAAQQRLADLNQVIVDQAKELEKNDNDILALTLKINNLKDNGLKIINAQTDQQRKQLELQQKQKDLALDEEQRKLNKQIEDGKKEIADLNKEAEKLQENLRKATEQDEIELQIKLGNVDAAVKNIVNTINSIGDNIDIRTEEIEKQLIQPFEKIAEIQGENLQAALDQFGSRIKEFVKNANDQTLLQIDKFLSETKTKLDDFKGQIVLDIEKGEDLDKINADISSEINKIREQAEKDFKLGKISENDLNEIKSSLSAAEEALKGYAKAQKDISDIKTGGLARTAAEAEEAGETFDKLAKSTKDLQDIVTKDFDKVSENVTDSLQDIADEAEKNPFKSLFKGLFSQEQKEELKNKIDQGVKAALDQLEKSKKELQDGFAELEKTNPDLAAKLKPVFENAAKGIEEGGKNIAESGDKAKENVDKTFNEALNEIIDKAEFWARQLQEVFNAIGEFETANLENRIKELEDFYDSRNEIIEGQLEQEQVYADQQAEIVNQSTSRLNELENQLQTARGSRAAFLQKLRAEEQARLQKAESERIASANRQKKLEEEQKKLEAQKAADLEAIEKKKFEIQKRSTIAGIILNTAFAVARALADPKGPPTSTALAIIAGALGAVQLATASAAKFAKGGLLEGPSHNDGGVPIMVNGGRLIEAEGGEFIINKKSTANNIDLIKQINENPNVKFQDGGMVPSTKSLNANLVSSVTKQPVNSLISDTQNLDRIVTTITDNLSNISVQASIQDIRDVNAINMQIDDLRRI